MYASIFIPAFLLPESLVDLLAVLCPLDLCDEFLDGDALRLGRAARQQAAQRRGQEALVRIADHTHQHLRSI